MSKTNRKTVSKRLRFEIFKRDGFACRYCGATPMATVLQIEHVVPVSKGGTNQPENLVTSCADCNQGKSDKHLDESNNFVIVDDEIHLLWEYTDDLGVFNAFYKSRYLMIMHTTRPIDGRSYWIWDIREPNLADPGSYLEIAHGTAPTRGIAQDLAEFHKNDPYYPVRG